MDWPFVTRLFHSRGSYFMIGKTISHYKILEKLGSGGMGDVYKAIDIKLQRTVALKFLPHDLTRDEAARQRFVHEARAASALDHSNIGTIHEVDECEGRFFIAMTYYEGETLKDKITSSKGGLDVEEAVNIAIQIAKGLTKAHSKDIFHRDIKPANIVITEDGQAKIIDFGLAKLKGRTVLTKTGTTLGTIAYMSPEQTQGTDVDHRTDIWALGVMLYEMLAGEQPFKGDYEQAVMYSIMNEEPEYITKVRGEVTGQVEKILEKALVKNPEKRFQTMKEMLDELTDTAEELKEGRRRKSPIFKLGRSQRRTVYRVFAGAFIVIIVLGIYLWQTRVAEAAPVSIVLLPMESITQDAEQAWFTDGMTDALITDLTKISGLRVISRSSAMRYKGTNKAPPEIAAELGVEYVIEGSVVKMGDQVKISARLINALEDEYLWAEDYEREFSNILGLQGEIAQSIAGQVKVKLTPQEETMLAVSRNVNPEAHEAYLKGLFHLYKFTPSGIETAKQYFELTLEKDPDYAPAHAGMATVWNAYQIQGLKSALETRPKANAAMMKALGLDSTLSEVHYMLAVIRSWTDYEWVAGEQAFRRALALNPNHAEAHAYYSQLLYVLRRPKEAMPHIQRALELDPFNTLLRALYGMDLNYAHRSDEAIEMLRNTLKTAPDVHPIVLSTLRTAYELEGMYEEALEMWKEFYAGRNDREGREALDRGYKEAGYHGAMLRMAEMMVERSKKTYVTPWQIATLYTRAGKKSEAIDWFEKAYDEHDTNVPALSMDPLFDGLRGEPRFKDLLRRMNLPNEE